MKFFLPLARNPTEAERCWRGIRRLLAARGLPTEERRIHSLYFRVLGKPRVLQVDADDGDTGEWVLAIYRAANAPFYWVVTPAHGIAEGAPMPIAAEGTRAVDFGPKKRDPPRRKRPSRP